MRRSRLGTLCNPGPGRRSPVNAWWLIGEIPGFHRTAAGQHRPPPICGIAIPFRPHIQHRIPSPKASIFFSRHGVRAVTFGLFEPQNDFRPGTDPAEAQVTSAWLLGRAQISSASDADAPRAQPVRNTDQQGQRRVRIQVEPSLIRQITGNLQCRGAGAKQGQRVRWQRDFRTTV